MPLIDYAVLRDLVARIDALSWGRADGPELRRRLEDAQYTVCVYTGLQVPEEAVAQARLLLQQAERQQAGPTSR
ncbi:DUF5133 domain-containing protein [Streptomyces sp. NPDC048324]|uniref:DUF5133 domain-containing protein n=1 Tax=Streptomyces sp. NPDC048324 TaxID=3157205 RepID=UPI00343B36BC